MKVLGITGGVGAGKSTILDLQLSECNQEDNPFPLPDFLHRIPVY